MRSPVLPFMTSPSQSSSGGKRFGLASALADACERHGIPPARVRPRLFDVKAGVPEKAADARVRKLVAVLGVDAFALREMDVQVGGGDSDTLIASAFQVHLDAAPDGIP